MGTALPVGFTASVVWGQVRAQRKTAPSCSLVGGNRNPRTVRSTDESLGDLAGTWRARYGFGAGLGPPTSDCSPPETSKSKLLSPKSLFLLPGPCAAHPGSSFLSFFLFFQTLGTFLRDLAWFPQVLASSILDWLRCPVFCLEVSGMLSASLPTTVPPNKVLGALWLRGPVPPPPRLPPSSATNVGVWEGSQMPPRTLQQ